MFKNNFIYLFGCAGSSRLLRLFSNCGEQKLLSGCGVQASHCSSFSCCETQTLKHRLRGSKARGIFLDQGLTPCLLHWQADSLPLSHQKSRYYFLNHLNIVYIFTYLKTAIEISSTIEKMIRYYTIKLRATDDHITTILE